MIQRKQSLYLFVAGLLMFLLFFMPIGEFLSASGEMYEFSAFNIQKTGEEATTVLSTFALGILYALTAVISVFNIFLYKKRTVQMRFCIFNIILYLAIGGLIYFYLSIGKEKIDGSFTFLYPVTFPAISLVLTYLAYRGIRKDEKLIRSLDRIR